MKRRTGDRASTTADPPSHGIHAPERIGKRRSKTPEGYLLCEDVPIARTGWMVYGPTETGVTADSNGNGVVMIHRSPEELFNPITMSSFNGKSVTDDHPPGGDVNAENWKEHARGHVMNVRRGEGEDEDTLRADLLITDKDTISAVNRGKVEVSAGYDANYETTGPGEGKQRNIIGNHVALVDQGRCGPRCAIGDSSFKSATPTGRKTPMSGKTRRTVTEAVRKLFTDASEAAVGLLEPAPAADGYDEEGDDDADGKGTHVHVHMHSGAAPGAAAGPVGTGQTGGADDAQAAGEAAAVGEGEEGASADPVEARFVAIEGTLAKILAKLSGDDGTGDDAMGEEDPAENPGVVNDEAAAPGGGTTTGTTGEDPVGTKMSTGDSAALATSFQTLVADCEVLVPGFKVPTFDAKLTRVKTVDSMCATRRKALDAFKATAEGAEALQTLGNAKLAGMTCDAAAVLFKAAVGVKKAANNTRTTDGAGRLPIVGDGSTGKTTTLTLSEINALNATKYPRN